MRLVGFTIGIILPLSLGCRQSRVLLKRQKFSPKRTELFTNQHTIIPGGLDILIFFFAFSLPLVIHILNPLNAELNPICHLLALLGAHHIFHVSGLRVNTDYMYVCRWRVGDVLYCKAGTPAPLCLRTYKVFKPFLIFELQMVIEY